MVNQYELNPEFWRDKTVVIIGGTGSMGTAMVKELMCQPVKNIRVAGQTELSKFKFIQELKGEDGWNKVHTKIRNMRDLEAMKKLTKDADIVINAAAMKDVDSGIEDPDEVYKTNIKGNMNVREACMLNNVEVCLFVSTDKATDPTTYYGVSKLQAEQIYESGNHEKGKDCRTKFGYTRCGNLWASRRSIILTWDEVYDKVENPHYQVTDPDMTRFFISIERASRYQLWCAEHITGTENTHFVPEIYSCSLREILKGRYPRATWEVIGAKPTEKLHESFGGEYHSGNPKCLKSYKELMEVL